MGITLDTIQASFHSITISDGTDTLAIANDGSIAVTDNGGSLTVDATNLDIRDLSAAQDNVAISDGTDTLAVNNDGSLNAVVSATNLDIRDLTHVSDSVKVGDGTDFLAIATDGSIAVTDNGGSLTVDASDLDIRDLTHVSDSVKIGDGTDFLAINNDGSINVTGSLTIAQDAFSTWQTSATTVTTTATQLASTPLTSRDHMVIQNLGNEDIYVGPANTVTTSNGLKIPKGSSQEIALQSDANIYAITANNTANVRVAEYAA